MHDGVDAIIAQRRIQSVRIIQIRPHGRHFQNLRDGFVPARNIVINHRRVARLFQALDGVRCSTAVEVGPPADQFLVLSPAQGGA